MEKKVIYNNGNSELSVKFDGEIVTIEQKADGVGHNSIFMYEDELEDIYKFVKEKGSSGIGMSEKLNGIKENWNNVDWGIDKNDIDWLIEQAEKVEQLEERIIEGVKSHWGCAPCLAYDKLQAKAERYEKALRKIIYESFCRGEDCAWGDTCYAVIARKALEGEAK